MRRPRRWWNRPGPVLVVGLTAVLVATNWSQAPATWRAARSADLGALVVAAALSLVHLASEGQMHRASQRSVNLDPGRIQALRLGAASRFLNAVTKSGGMAGLAVYSGDASRRGVARGGVVAAYVVTTALLDTAFALSLVAGIVLLAAVGRLSAVVLVAATVFAAYLGGRLALIAYGARGLDHVRRLYALPGQALRRIGLRRHTPAPLVDEVADEVFNAISSLRRRPRAVAPALLWAIGLQVLGVAELAAVLTSVDGARGLDVAAAGYTMALLFGIVGLLPSGAGFTDVSLGVVLVSFGSTVAEAAAAVALYRLVQLWLPVTIGAVAIRRLGPHTTGPIEAPTLKDAS